jgi:hypothetical protein
VINQPLSDYLPALKEQSGNAKAEGEDSVKLQQFIHGMDKKHH